MKNYILLKHIDNSEQLNAFKSLKIQIINKKISQSFITSPIQIKKPITKSEIILIHHNN